MESGEVSYPIAPPLYPGNNCVTDNLASEAAENIANAAFTALSSFSARAMRSANSELAPDRRKPAHQAC